jgi:hypothetical protein
MAKKNQHVVTTGDGNWGVRGAGNSKVTKKTPTQSEAIATRIATGKILAPQKTKSTNRAVEWLSTSQLNLHYTS